MTDLTSEFHRLLSSASRRNHKHSSHDSPSPTTAHQQPISSKRTGHKEPTEPFLLESYRLLDHINQLHYFLTRAQKFYLNLSSRAGTHLSAERNDEARWLASWAASRDGNAQQPPLALLQMLPKLRDLTEAEREEMDSQVQRALGGLFSRTEVLAQAAEQPVVGVVGPRVKKAGGLMTALFGDQEAKRRERMLVEHRRSVVWLLRKRLMDTSNVQKHMQERLLRQRLQKEETFLYSASRTTPALAPKSASPSTPSLPFNISLSNITSSLSASFNPSTALSFASQAGLVKRPASSNSPLKSTTTTAAADQQGAYPLHSRASSELLNQQHAADAGLKEEDEEDVAERLTNRERMMLETANAEILESLEGSLDQVRRTTNALQEISSLHGRLAYEIQTQATAIDALYEEAWKTTDTVHRGNKQLVSAQRRFGTARLWVLIFLVVASAVLLFLDYYAQ
ncbi:hypothetical protein HDU89_000307 [Geranomyces variabilis]|nr:hypothetical protein HDU89_000307 [Geranomyces variabilis]